MCRLNFGLIQTRFIYFFPFHEYYIHIAEAWKTAGIILHVLIVAITLPRTVKINEKLNWNQAFHVQFCGIALNKHRAIMCSVGLVSS